MRLWIWKLVRDWNNEWVTSGLCYELEYRNIIVSSYDTINWMDMQIIYNNRGCNMCLNWNISIFVSCNYFLCFYDWLLCVVLKMLSTWLKLLYGDIWIDMNFINVQNHFIVKWSSPYRSTFNIRLIFWVVICK